VALGKNEKLGKGRGVREYSNSKMKDSKVKKITRREEESEGSRAARLAWEGWGTTARWQGGEHHDTRQEKLRNQKPFSGEG